MSGSNYTQTPNLGLIKPTYNQDTDQWGTHLNQNADTLDAYSLGSASKNYVDTKLTGYLPLTGGTISPGQLTAPVSTSTVMATGGTTTRALQDRFADTVNVRDFGAVFDGLSHPLSGYYPTLAAAQAVYSHAIALTDEIDGVAIQAAINACQANVTAFTGGGVVQLPSDTGLINQPLTITKTNVSLRGGSTGLMVRSNVGTTSPSAPTVLKWNGPARTPGQGPIHMLTVAPLVADNRMLVGCNVTGILWHCNAIAGISGPLFMSVRDATIDTATYEPNGIAYPSSVLVAGSQSITVSSTTGLQPGQSLVSASLPEGAQIAAVVDATTITATTQATASSTETVTIGGTGIRFDVVNNLSDSNSFQLGRIRFWGQALLGAANATAPLVLIGGTDTLKAQPGNSCISWFDLIYTVNGNGVAVAINNSDHLFFQNISNVWLGSGSTPSLLVCNGSLDPRNGGARFHKFNHIAGAGAIRFVGTDTAGFTEASVGCVIEFLDRQNGAAYPTVGTGAGVRVSVDNYTPALANLGSGAYSTYGISAHTPDSTALGGNMRGIQSVDLQAARTAATQIASGRWTVLAGGNGNTVTGDYATVAGGQSNTASALNSTVLGGFGNSSSGNYSVSSGVGATSDLYAVDTHSGGTIASGRRAQFVKQLLRAVSAANTTPVRLTADALAAGAVNSANLPYSDQTNAIRVQLIAVDPTANNAYAWSQPLGLIQRKGTVGTVTYIPGTPVVVTRGTTTGIAITEAADTTNGGYSLTFTPPTGNTAAWRVVATVEWTRVDGT